MARSVGIQPDMAGTGCNPLPSRSLKKLSMNAAYLLRAGFVAVLLQVITLAAEPSPRTLELSARDTLTVAKLHHGDTLQFKLKSGEPRTFVLKNTSAQI